MPILHRQLFLSGVCRGVRCLFRGAVVLLSSLAVSLAGAAVPTLRSMSTFPSGGEAQYTAVADVNQDGKQDVIVSNFNGTITVLFGNGDGTFGAPHTIASFPAGGYPIASADFNRDGKPDLAVLDPTKEMVSIYLGNGDGTFAAPKTALIGNSPAFMSVGDVNGDGSPDLIFNASHTIGGTRTVGFTVMLSAGNGYLHAPLFVAAKNGAAGWVLAVGDVNNDGHLDVVTTDGLQDAEVFLGNGNGTFREQSAFYMAQAPSQILLADLFGDGNLDLAIGSFGVENAFGVPNSQGSVEVMQGTGTGKFELSPVLLTAGYFPAWMAAADMNGDGRVDLVVGNSTSNSISVLINNGGGMFSSSADNYATPMLLDGIGQGPMSIGDFNGDKKPDVAVATSVGVDVLLNMGGGVLKAPASVEVAGDSGQMVAADFSGKGHLDLAVQNNGYNGNAGAVNLLQGDGQGNFASNPLYYILPLSESPYGTLAAGSFNGNGKTGVAAYVYDGQIQPDYNLGLGLFTPAPLVNLAQQDRPQYMCAGDFNGDGYSDFAVLSYDQVDIYLNRHDGTYSGPVSYAVGSNPVFMMARDVNSDGKIDLITANNSSDSVSVLLGKGNGTFWPAKEYPAGYKPDVVTSGDFNRDGKIDLAVGDSNKVSILLGKGDGTFAAPTSFSAPGPVTYVAVADLRGTGVEDLLTTTTAESPASSAPERIYLLSGNGNGTFNAPQAYIVGSNPYWIVPGDFNEDGAVDVAVSSYFESTTVVVLLNQRGTRISLNSSAATAKTGQAVTLDATLAASVADSGIPTGMVAFRDGSSTLGSVNLVSGKATLSTSALSAGKHTITAAYEGSSAFNPHASNAVIITVE